MTMQIDDVRQGMLIKYRGATTLLVVGRLSTGSWHVRRMDGKPSVLRHRDLVDVVPVWPVDMWRKS